MELLPDDLRSECRHGILLVCHGTRSGRGIHEFRLLAEQVAQQVAPWPVESAFLELCHPTIKSGLARLTERSVEHVVVVPLLLFAAGHAKNDIPGAVATALADLGFAHRLSISLAGHLGCHPGILELSARRFAESLCGRDAVPADDTCLLLVGRGSLDPSATAEMYEFARRRSAATPVRETHVAFLAMAQPALGETLSQLAAQKWRRIVVQPHLLWHGELYDGMLAQVANMDRQTSVTEWIVTSYLASQWTCDFTGAPVGHDPSWELVAQAVLARASAAARESGIRVVAPFLGR